MSVSLGNKTEELAKNYLTSEGLILVVANFRLKFGEIDLIMLDKDILTFVEVKYRKDNKFMEALETVNRAKQNKIKKVALYFLQKNIKYQNYICRFDVITLCGNMDKLEFFWLKNAFY
tara:strand:+ start:20371 stop:20724 length:354 start_codon:yes stop_codon:yes gene_type:complete